MNEFFAGEVLRVNFVVGIEGEQRTSCFDVKTAAIKIMITAGTLVTAIKTHRDKLCIECSTPMGIFMISAARLERVK